MLQVLNNKYKVIKEIGNGSIGKVFLCQFEDDSKRQISVAVKQISDKTNYGQLNKYLKQELDIIQMLINQNKNENKCDNVLQLYEIFQEDQYYYIVSEFCQVGDLYQYLSKNHQNLSTQNFVDIIIQIAKGIQYLHNINLAHRDLKPENILIRYNKGLQLVITDFGVSSIYDLKSTVGTINYMAPEILKFQTSYDKAVDIWSFGCIMYEIIYNEQLFYGQTTQQVLSLIRNFQSYKKKDDRPLVNDLNEIIEKCLSLDVTQRSSIQEILLKLGDIQNKLKILELQQIEKDEYQSIDELNEDQDDELSTFSLTTTSEQILQTNQTKQNNNFQQQTRIKDTLQPTFLDILITKCIQYGPLNDNQENEIQQNNQKQFVNKIQILEFLNNFTNDQKRDEYKASVLLDHILNCDANQYAQFIQEIEEAISIDDDQKRYFYFCLIQCVIEKDDQGKIDKFFQFTKNKIFQQIVKKLIFQNLNQFDAQKKVKDSLESYKNNFDLVKFILAPFVIYNMIILLIRNIFTYIKQSYKQIKDWFLSIFQIRVHIRNILTYTLKSLKQIKDDLISSLRSEFIRNIITYSKIKTQIQNYFEQPLNDLKQQIDNNFLLKIISRPILIPFNIIKFILSKVSIF